MDKKELIEQLDNANEHIMNVNKIMEIVIQRFQGQQESGGGHSSFGFGIGRNWIEAGLMTVGTQLLTSAASSGLNKMRKNKKTRAVADKIETLSYDSYYDKCIRKKILPENVTSDMIMDIAKDVCWAIGI